MFRSRVASDAWSAWGGWQTSSTTTRTDNINGTTYQFQVKARCQSSNNIGDESAESDPASIVYYTPATAPSTPSTTAGLSGSNVIGTASVVTCTVGSVQYRVDRRTNDGSWVTGSWGSGRTSTVAVSPGSKYGFRSTARCVNEASTATSATSAEVIYTSSITTPSAPSVESATVAGKNWTWTAAACPSGTTARYQYQFMAYTTGGSWVATASATATNSAATSQGMRYGINVQQQCYTTYASSGWSGSGAGGEFWVPVVHQKAAQWAIRLTTHTDSKYYISYILKTFSGTCASGTVQDTLARTSLNTVGSPNNWVNDDAWFENVGANSAKRVSNNSPDGDDVVEVYLYGRCRNTTTAYTTNESGYNSWAGITDTGNLYSRSGKYNIECADNGHDIYCAGGYNSGGTKQTSTASVLECRKRTDAQVTTSAWKSYSWTARFNNGSNNPCWDV